MPRSPRTGRARRRHRFQIQHLSPRAAGNMTKTSNVREPRPAKPAGVQTFKNFIGGEWVSPANDSYFDNRNPAQPDDLIGRFPDSDQRDVDAAVRSAKRGFPLWSRTPAPVRGDVLRR